MSEPAYPVQFTALKDVEPGRFLSAADSWKYLQTDFNLQMLAYHLDTIGPLHDGSWHGRAGDAARGAVSNYYQNLVATEKYIESVYILLQDASMGLRTAKDRLTAALGVANTPGVQADADGKLQLLDVSAADWDNPPIKWAMKAQNMIYQSRRMATLVDERVSAYLQFVTKFGSNGSWIQDADGDLQLAQSLYRDLSAALGGIATEEFPHQDTPQQPRSSFPFPDPQSLILHTGLRNVGVPYFYTKGIWAATLLWHWLENSGAPFQVDPVTMMQDIPTFKNIVVDSVNDACRPLPGHFGELDPYDSVVFDTSWQNTNTEDGDRVQSLDWYYALNDFRFRVVGIASPIVDGRRDVEYTVGVWKPYVFGPPRKPISLPGGLGKIDQLKLAELHFFDLAQNFIVQGISHHVTQYPI
ncbi:MAG: hypothetical protein ACRDR6_01905 [Pseudonocardiaceae bacterium]